MKKIKLQLQTKIALLIVFVLMVSIVNTAFFITKWRMDSIKEDLEDNILNVAQIIANAPVIKGNLGINQGEGLIQPYIENILKSTEGIDVIVVADMKGIRYGHPNPARLGEAFVGGDEKRVIEKGEIYTSQAQGTLGNQLRVFVPVYNMNNEQVGFVMVGQLVENIQKVKRNTVAIVIISSLGGFLLGLIGVVILTNRIKNTLLGFEPEQISTLYIEKTGMLEAMQEGIIAIDNNSKITLINNSAIKMLKLGEKETVVQDMIGKDINQIFPSCRLPEVILSGQEEKFKEHVINDTIVMINRVPIKEGKKVIGAIATFIDKTMVTRLAEEVTGVKQMVEALRASNHEFLNKLHVILGYIQLNRLEDAKNFIVKVREKHQHILSFIMNNILEPSVAALILGKISRGKELGITMKINEESYLSKKTEGITGNVLVTIIGNLLENAMESLSICNKDRKDIVITIKENPKEIYLKVEDNGVGISKNNLSSIFHKGYSTKIGDRGRGLALIKEIIDNLKGSIEVFSTENQGAEFIVIIPKGGSYND